MKNRYVLSIILISTLIIIMYSIISYPKEVRLYWKNGNIKQEYFEDINGKIKGLVMSYNEQGELVRKTEFKNGLQTGYDSSYFTDGTLKGVSYFVNGIGTDSTFQYHKNGNIKLKGYLKNGKLYGEYQMFYENGYLEEIGLYDSNENLNGIFRKYDRNGNPIWLEFIKHGVTITEVHYLSQSEYLILFKDNIRGFKIEDVVQLDTILNNFVVLRVYNNNNKIMLQGNVSKDYNNKSISFFIKEHNIEEELKIVKSFWFNNEKVNVLCHNDECLFIYSLEDIHLYMDFKKEFLSEIETILTHIKIVKTSDFIN